MIDYGDIRLSRPFPRHVPIGARYWLPGRASDFISPFNCVPGSKFALWLRVSGREQNRTANLDDQESSLTRVVESHGGTVCEAFPHVGSGWFPDEPPEQLCNAIEFATANKAILLAESPDRFARHRDYHSKKRSQLQVNIFDLQRFQRMAGNVTLMTLTDPDATLSPVRSVQTKRGQHEKDEFGGVEREHVPGWTKKRKKELKPKVENYLGEGLPMPRIVKRTKVSTAQLYRWRDQYIMELLMKGLPHNEIAQLTRAKLKAILRCEKLLKSS